MTLGAGLDALARADECESARGLRRRVRGLVDLCDAHVVECEARGDVDAARWWQERSRELSIYADQLIEASRSLGVL